MAGPLKSEGLDPNKTGPESSEENGALLFFALTKRIRPNDRSHSGAYPMQIPQRTAYAIR
ncbi:MAG TPA: hypothetical protein DCG06_10070 [Deltaproteobacteria bacterium]|nr:hypothetical protein [Deltaproteobacteria bacterium]